MRMPNMMLTTLALIVLIGGLGYLRAMMAVSGPVILGCNWVCRSSIC